MDVTLFLAQFFGLFLIVEGLMLLIKRKDVPAMIVSLTSNVAVFPVLGLLTFAAGLLIVLSHNVWEGSTAILISLIGWIILLKGLAYVFVPNTLVRMSRMWSKQSVLVIIGVVALIIGLYLAYQGFGFSY